MGPKFSISEVCSTSWQRTKTQIWVLAGLLIGMTIISFTLSAFAMPMQKSIVGTIVINLISCIISCIFALGYMKNIFQALDGEEPQFSAYGQQARKIITYFVANLFNCAELVFYGDHRGVRYLPVHYSRHLSGSPIAIFHRFHC